MLRLEEVKEWLGISNSDDDKIINSLIIAADGNLKNKVGSYSENDENAKLYMKYFISINYTDRLGEMSNKESSATSKLMQNIIFALRVSNIENNDAE